VGDKGISVTGPRWYLGKTGGSLSLVSDRNGTVDEGERRDVELLEADGGERSLEVKRPAKKIFAFSYWDLPMRAGSTGDSGMGVDDLQEMFDSIDTGESLTLRAPRERGPVDYVVALTSDFHRSELSLVPERTEACTFTLEEL